jgi:hypothetical protein
MKVEGLMNRSIFIISLALPLILGVGSLSHAGSAAAPRLEQSTIRINAAAANISAENVQGGTSTSRNGLGKKNRSSTAEGPTRVEIGAVEVSGAAVIKHSEININAVAGGVHARGATVRVGTVAVGRE